MNEKCKKCIFRDSYQKVDVKQMNLLHICSAGKSEDKDGGVALMEVTKYDSSDCSMFVKKRNL